MRVASGHRPWPILLFTGITTYLATFRLWDGLADISAAIRQFSWAFPYVDWNRDLAIIATSAWFTIDMIPVILVLVFAARFARMFISAMALVPMALLLSNLDYASTYPRMLGPSILVALLPVALAALLWTKSANQYFANDGARDAPSA